MSQKAAEAKVWYTHEYKDTNGKVITYRVQDVTPDLHQRLVEYYTSQFLNDETICKHLKWTQDEVSTGEYVKLIEEALCGGYSLVVLEDDGASDGKKEQEIVGAGMYLLEGDGKKLMGEGRSFRVLMTVVAALAKHKSKPGGAGKSVTGVGMWVRRDRRRRGIGEAIVRGVVASCRGKAVPRYSAFYTGIGSQRAAAKAGLQEEAVVEYAEIMDENGKPALPGIPEKYIKVYGINLEM